VALPSNLDFEIDGRPVRMEGWQADAETDRGDRTLTGRLPRSVTWASQGAPVVAWRRSGDAAWSGTLVADPRIVGDELVIRAEGHANEIASKRERMFYRIDGGEKWVDSASDPHSYAQSEKYDLHSGPGALVWKYGNNADAFAIGDIAGFILWMEGALITRYSTLVTVSQNMGSWDLRTHSATGPTGTATLIGDHSLNPPTTYAQNITTPEDALLFSVRCNTANTPGNRRRVRAGVIKVYGRTTDDTFSASDVVSDVGGNAGLDTSNVQTSSLAVLPLDWTEDHAALLDYMAELTDWRWLALHDGLHFGPYERTWEAFTDIDGTPELEPERRYNRVVVPYRSVSGALLEAVGTPATDPFPGQEIVLLVDELEDPQPDSTVADAVASTRAAYEASVRFTGRMTLSRVRYRGEARSPYDVTAGDLLSLPDLAPTVGSQRIRSVTYHPEDRATVEFGSGFNVVKALADASREQAGSRRRKKRRRRR
jgi:hypothetical protein